MAVRRAAKIDAKPEIVRYVNGLCRMYSLPLPQTEVPICDGRKWRLDFGWHLHAVALEVDGGIFVNGGHNRGVQIMRDYEKRNAANLAGWEVLQMTTEQVKFQSGAYFGAVMQYALQWKGELGDVTRIMTKPAKRKRK